MQCRRCLMLMLAVLVLCPSANGFSAEFASHEGAKAWQVEREFALFTADWIDKVNRNYASRQNSIEVTKEDFFFTGRFSEIEKGSVIWTVKQIPTSPDFIGLLEYMEWVYESSGITHEDAINGPFLPVKGRKVTEIFRYSQNRWIE